MQSTLAFRMLLVHTPVAHQFFFFKWKIIKIRTVVISFTINRPTYIQTLVSLLSTNT